MNLRYLATSSDTAHRPTTGIVRVFAFVMLGYVGHGRYLDMRPNISPSAIVERFKFLLQASTH
jgi:hypothetical protein